MRALVVGVDPGYTGAIVFYDYAEDEIAYCFDMPVRIGATGWKEIDGRGIKGRFGRVLGEIKLVVIEEVGARPKDGRTSAFRFGYGAGQVRTAMENICDTVILSPPGVWKSAMGLNQDKKRSLAKAREAFPNSLELFKRQKDHGRAEAALMAKWGYNIFLKGV